MRAVAEIFGTDSGTYINLNWAGRKEHPSEVARRLAGTMALLSDRTEMRWYRDTANRNSNEVKFELVPTTEEALIDFLNPRNGQGRLTDFLSEAEEEWCESPDWMGFHIILRAGSDRNATTLAYLTGSTASSMERRNQVKLQLLDDFPLGSPSEAAHWFLHLVRIWQPDHSRLSNSAAQLVTGLTRAAYLSWTSAKAYTEPESSREIRIPFGDGNLCAARVWTPQGISMLDRELAQAGAPRYSNRPTKQNPPTFPEDYPEELSTLDRGIIVEYGVSATDE